MRRSLHLHRALPLLIAALHVEGKQLADPGPTSVAGKDGDMHEVFVRAGGGFDKTKAPLVVPSDQLPVSSHG